MAACVLGNLDLHIPTQSYVNLKDTILHSNLEAAVAAVDPKGDGAVAEFIRNAVNNETKDWYVRMVTSEDKKDNALILKCGDEVQVCFPGTVLKNATTLKADLDIARVPFETSGGRTCRVDKGFLDRAGNIAVPVMTVLEELQPKEISINGYSLGAGVAMLFALDLDDDLKQNVQKICTFATPHVGDLAFSLAVEREFADGATAAGKVFNVRNREDPVTYVPPPPWYVRSPGYDIPIDGNGNDNSPLKGRFTEEIWDIIQTLDITHHMPLAYFKGMEKLQQQAPHVLNSPSAERLHTQGRYILGS